MKLELFKPHFLELFIFGEIRFLKQLFKPLSVAMVFGMQAIYLFAQQRSCPSSIKHLRILQNIHI